MKIAVLNVYSCTLLGGLFAAKLNGFDVYCLLACCKIADFNGLKVSAGSLEELVADALNSLGCVGVVCVYCKNVLLKGSFANLYGNVKLGLLLGLCLILEPLLYIPFP